MKEYDLIVSLGANCSAAANMKRRGLRRCSLPFDWLYVTDDRPLLWLSEHLQDGLRGFCLKENLVRITPEHPEWSATDARKFKYIDTGTGYRFIHLFRRPIEGTDEYECVLPVLRKRIDRMYELVGKSQRVLLLLATGKQLGDGALRKVKEAFERRFPHTSFTMEFLKFDDAPFNEVKSSERSPAEGIRIVEVPRAINEYDFSVTNFEWSFLDEMALSERVVRPGLWARLVGCGRRFIRWLRKVWSGRMV